MSRSIGITSSSCVLCYRHLRFSQSPGVARRCLLESPDVVCALPRPSRRAIRRRRPVRVMDSPVLMEHNPLAAAGELVFDCRPPLLPVSMDISGVNVLVILASAVSAEAAAFPPEREQSFGGGGGGGDLLSLICPELGLLHWWTRERI